MVDQHQESMSYHLGQRKEKKTAPENKTEAKQEPMPLKSTQAERILSPQSLNHMKKADQRYHHCSGEIKKVKQGVDSC